MFGPVNPDSSGGKVDIIDFDDPIYIHPSDNSVTTVVTLKLTSN